MKDSCCLVSIVIPTLNSGKYLASCLQSIRKQTYLNIETIIVDSFSTDPTVKIAEKYNAKTIFCRGIRSEARNVGVKVSKGEFILCLDSDMQLTPNVINECVDSARNGFDAIVIPELSVGEGFWAKCKTLEKLCYNEDDLIEASRFFRRAIFESIHGYDPELEAGEDWDLHQRILKFGGHVGRVHSVINHNEGHLSLKTSISKKYYYGKTLDRYILKNPDVAKKQLSIFRPAFFRCRRKLAQDPVHAMGLIIMKTCEYIAAEVGYMLE
jgi:glycosyltransferase involved in cell wall biosynthesis